MTDSETSHEPPKASLRAKLVLLGLASFFSAGVAEIALRVVEPPSGWGNVPPLEERLEDIPATGTPGQKRVLALGDSFTEYRDDAGLNWVRFYEKLARADLKASAPGIDLALMNFGQMGTGVRHFQKIVDDYGKKAAPNLVLVGLYLGNDLLDFELELRKKERGLEIPAAEVLGRRPSGVAATFKRHSALVRLIARFVKMARGGGDSFAKNLEHAAEIYGTQNAEIEKRLAQADAAIVEKAEKEQINNWDLAFAIVAKDRYRHLYELPEGGVTAKAFDDMLEALAKLTISIQQGLGSEVAIVLIPTGAQVDPLYAEYLTLLGFDVPAVEHGVTRLWKRLRAELPRRGIPLIDPLPDLRAAQKAGGDRLYLPMDTHLTPRGQEVVGRAVFDQLKKPLPAPAEIAPAESEGFGTTTDAGSN